MRKKLTSTNNRLELEIYISHLNWNAVSSWRMYACGCIKYHSNSGKLCIIRYYINIVLYICNYNTNFKGIFFLWKLKNSWLQKYIFSNSCIRVMERIIKNLKVAFIMHRNWKKEFFTHTSKWFVYFNMVLRSRSYFWLFVFFTTRQKAT